MKNTDYPSRELGDFQGIRERDVDLALVIALQASEQLRDLVRDVIGCQARELVSAANSVSTVDRREADVVLTLGSKDASTIIEIENKIDAVFQPNQAEGYAARAAARRVADGEPDGYALLVAPAKYLQAHAATAGIFDGALSLERIRDVLAGDGVWGQAIADLLQHAIMKHRRGGAATVPHVGRTRFFAEFAALAESMGLPTVPAVSRGANAGFLWYPRNDTLRQPSGWRVSHGSQGAWLAAKLIHGHADIELTGILEVVDAIDFIAAVGTREGIVVATTGSSVQIRRRAPVLDLDAALDSQLTEARAVVEQLEEARTWWEHEGCGIAERAIVSAAL